MFKKLSYYFISFLIILSGPVQILLWSVYIQPNWGTFEVIKATKTIERGELISSSNVTIKKIKAADLVSHSVSEFKLIEGQEATRTIFNGEQITEEAVNSEHLVPGKNQLNMPMPNDWILAKPGSLLRGDHVYLYPVKRSSISTDTSENVSDDNSAVVEVAAKEDITAADHESLKDIIVSFSKSSNNQEVTTTDGRKKPTGAVNTFELIVTLEQQDAILTYVKNGYQFLVDYH